MRHNEQNLETLKILKTVCRVWKSTHFLNNRHEAVSLGKQKDGTIRWDK